MIIPARPRRRGLRLSSFIRVFLSSMVMAWRSWWACRLLLAPFSWCRRGQHQRSREFNQAGCDHLPWRPGASTAACTARAIDLITAALAAMLPIAMPTPVRVPWSKPRLKYRSSQTTQYAVQASS